MFARRLAEHEVWVLGRGRRPRLRVLTEDELLYLYLDPGWTGRGHRHGALRPRARHGGPGGFSFWVFQQNEGARRFYEPHGSSRSSSPTARATRRRLPTSGTSGSRPHSRRPLALDAPSTRTGRTGPTTSARAARGRLRVLRGGRRDRARSIRSFPQARRTTSSDTSTPTSSGAGCPSSSSSRRTGIAAARTSSPRVMGHASAARCPRRRGDPDRGRRRAAGRLLHPAARRPRRGRDLRRSTSTESCAWPEPCARTPRRARRRRSTASWSYRSSGSSSRTASPSSKTRRRGWRRR